MSNAANITVSLRSRQSTGDLGTELATLSGTAASGQATFTCSGSGCALTTGGRYFVYIAGTGSSDANLTTTASDNETLQPSGNGWSIANAAYDAGLSGLHPGGVSMKMRVTALSK